PASVSVGVGQPAAFGVSATGTGPISYQWKRGGGALAGATASAYQIARASVSDRGARFSGVVSNSGGMGTGGNAGLSVTAAPPPPPAAQFAGNTVAAGYRHSVYVHSDGTVWAVGRNNMGQIGDGSTTDRTAWTQVQGLTGVVSVGAGDL